MTPTHKTVPVEPTEEMLENMARTNNCYDSGNYAAVYKFALDAAPSTPPLTDSDMREILADAYREYVTTDMAEDIRAGNIPSDEAAAALAAMTEAVRRATT